MAKNLSDLLGEWERLVKVHRDNLVKHKFSNKFAVAAKEVDSLVVHSKVYAGQWGKQSKVVDTLLGEIVAEAESIRKKLHKRLTATKQEKALGDAAIEKFSMYITVEAHEKDPKLLEGIWVKMLDDSKTKNKALFAVATESKIRLILKKVADEQRKLDEIHEKQATANVLANRKTDFDIKPDLEKNMKSLAAWDDRTAALEVAAFLKDFKKALDVVIY